MTYVLMLCHDQHLDRRVIAQASSLIQLGHKVTLLALSYTNEDVEEQLPEGIHLKRIGLTKIIPDNKIYRRYTRLQSYLNTLLNKLSNNYPKAARLGQVSFRIASRANWLSY